MKFVWLHCLPPSKQPRGLLLAQEGRPAHVMDLATNRGLNLLLNFLLIVLVLVLAFILVKLMWTIPGRFLFKSCSEGLGFFCNDNVRRSIYLTRNTTRLHRLKYLTEKVFGGFYQKWILNLHTIMSCHWIRKVLRALLSTERNTSTHKELL